MEGGFYYVILNVVDDVYKLELKSNPEINSSSGDLEGAVEILYQKIIGWNGDGEPHLEFLKPNIGEWYLLEPDEGVNLKCSDVYFESKVCHGCSYPVGRRTNAPLQLKHKPKGGICYGTLFHEQIYFYNRSLIEKIVRYSFEKLEFQEVYYKEKPSGYYELLSCSDVTHVLPLNIDVNLEARTSFECLVCGRLSFQGKHDVNQHYFPKSKLQGSMIKVVKADSSNRNALAVDGNLFDSNFKRTKKERFFTTKINLLEDNEYYVPKNFKKVEWIDWKDKL